MYAFSRRGLLYVAAGSSAAVALPAEVGGVPDEQAARATAAEDPAAT